MDYEILPAGPTRPRKYSETRLVSRRCFSRFSLFLIRYCGSVAIGVLLVKLGFHMLGGLLLALGPSWCIISHYSARYGDHILPKQWLFIAIECAVLIVPMHMFERWLNNALSQEKFGLLQVALTAFGVYAATEEVLKYVLSRRFLWKAHVSDPRALMFYCIVAANAFAAWENIWFVVFQSGAVPTPRLTQLTNFTWPQWQNVFNLNAAMPPPAVASDDNTHTFAALGANANNGNWLSNKQANTMIHLGLMRALLAIPLHSSTGALIGGFLGKRRFLGERTNVAYILVLPILLHGTYDFAASGGLPLLLRDKKMQMLNEQQYAWLVYSVLVLTYTIGLLLAKRMTSQFATKVPPVSLRTILSLKQGVDFDEVTFPWPDTMLHDLVPWLFQCCWPRLEKVNLQPAVVQPLL
eukprot:GDKI01047246.1.p1 GENE.GDKI01047246.1~~GDKI01047246.1.p1  ORF type:complete len:409 (-),score=85.62 GDKI01047246.1:74-1300(-)